MLWIIRFFDIMITLWWLRDGCLQKIPDGDSQFSFSPLPHTPVTGVIHNDSLLIAKLKELWKVWKKKQHCHSKKRPLKVTFKRLYETYLGSKKSSLRDLLESKKRLCIKKPISSYICLQFICYWQLEFWLTSKLEWYLNSFQHTHAIQNYSIKFTVENT